MLICEELFLLLRRDDGKAESAWAYNGYGLAAAVLTDLILAARITLGEDKDPRVTVVGDQPVGDPVLDQVLELVRTKDGKKLSSLVTDGKLDVTQLVADALQARGIIDIEDKRALGLVPAKYPVADPVPERQVRERLRTVLAGGTATPSDATLLAILQGLSLTTTVLAEEARGMSKKQLKERTKEIAHDSAAGLAVGKAVETMNVILMAVVFTPVISGVSY